MEQYANARPQIEQFMNQYDNEIGKHLDQIRKNISEVLAPAMPGLTQIAEMATAMVRDARPPNWSEDVGLDLAKLKQVTEVEGIPLVYVPRAEIVVALLGAADFEGRLSILDDRYEDICSDCRTALKNPVDSQVADRAQLVLNAIDAFEDGHYEAAQALAVVVTDSYLKTHVSGRYKEMRESLALDESDEASLWPLLRFFMPMAAVVPFLVQWDPSDPNPAPTSLSRHVTIHDASTAQLNRINATLAIMLAASITCALDAALHRYGRTTGI